MDGKVPRKIWFWERIVHTNWLSQSGHRRPNAVRNLLEDVEYTGNLLESAVLLHSSLALRVFEILNQFGRGRFRCGRFGCGRLKEHPIKKPSIKMAQ